MDGTFDRRAFAKRVTAMRRGYPQSYWAKRIGLTYGALRDLEQARVDPSRAMVLLINAMEMSPGFMEDVVRRAKADLAAFDGRGRSVISTGK
jgi:hypothetical protein